MVKPGGLAAVFMAVAACSLVLIVSGADEKIKEAAVAPSSSVKVSNTYTHAWPAMEFGWRIVVGTIMAFCGAAFGSVGGVGGGGIFVPMLALVLGFDTKSSAAISKCMIVGAAASTVYYNIRQRHPTLDMSIIDYDLALLFQPMLVLGISLGVTFNVIFADWMVTLILIILCIVTSTKAFFKGIEKWKKETIQKEAETRLSSIETDLDGDTPEPENTTLPGGSNKRTKVPFVKNVQWKKLAIIICVWMCILTLQIIKSYTSTCSTLYWVFNLSQIPVAVAAAGYEAVMLYKGKTAIASRGDKGTNFKAPRLVFYMFIGVFAGTIAGLVGVGGGLIMGPLFLEMGIPPQVASATATFAMLFSSSMSVVEYYLLKRFPIPYRVTTIAALAGQYIVKRVLKILGRASLIIFILALTVFISAFLIGGEGTVNVVHKIEHHSYMGFESMCSDHTK
ncbi:hypothetical protein V2J09_004546 [Rumex salicifolius]